MSPSLAALNEVLQWTTLVAVVLILLAVYRQLGMLIGSAPEAAAYAFGPVVGKRAGQRLLSLFPDDGIRPWKLLVFVRENCTACDDLLSHVEGWIIDAARDRFHLVLVVNGSSLFADQLGVQIPEAVICRTDGVLDNGQFLEGRQLLAYPFTILMSSDGIVRYKLVGSDANWLRSIVMGSASAPTEEAVNREP